MIIIVEDYNGNELCKLDINTFKDISEIENLIGCDIADVDKDEQGNEYLRLQLNKDNILIKSRW